MDLYSRANAVISGICLFCCGTKYKAVFTVLIFFYLVILTFTKSLFLTIENINEVHSKSEESVFKLSNVSRS